MRATIYRCLSTLLSFAAFFIVISVVCRKFSKKSHYFQLSSSIDVLFKSLINNIFFCSKPAYFNGFIEKLVIY